MTEVYKITHNIYDPDASLKLTYHSDSITRENKYKLSNHRFYYDLRKYCFFLHVLLMIGIVYLTMLSMLILLTFLKRV